MRVLAWLAAAGTAALVLAGATAASRPPSLQKKALEALAKAVSAHHVDPASARADRAEIARAARLARTLPSGRREPVSVALRQVAALIGKLDEPRAAAVFGQLKANDDYFSRHWPPAPKTDVTDDDGLVYRYFPGRCLEFHPLANFGALNAAVASHDVERTRALADALAARGVHEPGGGIGWEYLFDYAGGHAPWLSGMAQAVAAQAFERAATLVTDRSSAYSAQARAAYQAISPRLLTHVAAGPWIRLYGFNRLPVLNAQLQTVVSLQSYAKAADDPTATALAGRLQHSAAAMLGRFDTGYWSLYSLDGTPSPVDYQELVVGLLKRLGKADPRFADASQRFASYLVQPPAFRVANAGLGQVRFWLSKPASVRIDSGAGPSRRLSLRGGWHTVGWPEPRRPGIYGVAVSATGWAGHSASFQALPIVRVAAPPARKPVQRVTAGADPTAAPPAFTVGAGLDDPSQAALAAQLGVHTVRMDVAWPSGAIAPDASVVAALQRLPPGTSLILELAADPPPVDDASRAALASYATALVQQVPSLRDLILVPAPGSSTAADYAAMYAAVAGSVQAVAPDVATGVSIDGAADPKAAVAALGSALAGAPVDVVAFRPAPAGAKGAWTSDDVPQLAASLEQALGSTPPVLLDGLAGSPTEDARAIAAAQCSPSLAGAIVDRVADSTSADAPADGVFTAAGTAKVGTKTLIAAIAAAERGNALCPGVTSPAAAADLAFPASLATGRAAAIRLSCVRDCLYLVTLDRGDGRPVVARRGSLVGGAADTTIALPQARLREGSYRLDVRLVSQVNPGAVTRLQSPPLRVG